MLFLGHHRFIENQPCLLDEDEIEEMITFPFSNASFWPVPFHSTRSNLMEANAASPGEGISVFLVFQPLSIAIMSTSVTLPPEIND